MFFCEYPPSFADSGYLTAEQNKVYLTTLDFQTVRTEADSAFVRGYDSPTEAEQEKYYTLAMQKYFISGTNDGAVKG